MTGRKNIILKAFEINMFFIKYAFYKVVEI